MPGRDWETKLGVRVKKYTCLVKQMHTSRMPTAFMKFNYVHILPCRAETLPLFLAIAFALLRIQTEQTLPLIRLTSSLFVMALETTLYAVCVFF